MLKATSTSSQLLKAIDDFINPDLGEDTQIDSLNQIIIGVHQKNISIGDLVETLGDYLTNLDELIRGRATLLIAEVLSRLPTLALSDQHTSHLTNFFVQRLQDYPTLPFVLKGLHAISLRFGPTSAEAEAVAQGLFGEVGSVQALPLAARRSVFDLIERLVSHCAPALKGVGRELALAFTQAMDGERDPRILLTALRTAKLIGEGALQGWETAADALFDVTAVYFPVAFNPKPGDPTGISREDLHTTLRAAITASPLYAPSLLPLLLDKLQSTIPETARDSFDVLAYAAVRYQARDIAAFSPELWAAMRRHVATPKVTEEACRAAAAVTEALTRGEGATILIGEWADTVASDLSRSLDAPAARLVVGMRGVHDKVRAVVLPGVVAGETSAGGVALLGALAQGRTMSGEESTYVARCLVSPTAEVVSAACEAVGSLAPHNPGAATLLTTVSHIACDHATPAVREAAVRAVARVAVDAPALLTGVVDGTLKSLAAGSQGAAAVLAALVRSAALRPTVLPATLSAARAALSAGGAAAAAAVAALSELCGAVGDPVGDVLLPALSGLGQGAALADASLSALAQLVSFDGPPSSPSATLSAAVLTAVQGAACGAWPAAGAYFAGVCVASPSTAAERWALAAIGNACNKCEDPVPVVAGVRGAVQGTPQRSTAIAWCAKGLLLRGSAEWELLGREVLEAVLAGEASPASLSEVLVPAEGLLDKAGHATIRPLTTQRAITALLPLALGAGERGLGAAAALVSGAPPPVVMPWLDQLLPALDAALANPTAAEGAVSVVASLCTAAAEHPQMSEAVSRSLPSMVRGLCAAASQHPRMTVRAAALDVLAAVAESEGLKPSSAPLRDAVLGSISPLLDDPKRVVRRAAVKARNLWYLLK